MLITLEEMKNYLRVDFDDDDALIETLISSKDLHGHPSHREP